LWKVFFLFLEVEGFPEQEGAFFLVKEGVTEEGFLVLSGAFQRTFSEVVETGL